MDKDCIFCKIVAGIIPAQKEYEDDGVLAFRDAHPAAPVHVLVIPKVHLRSLGQVGDQVELMGKIQAVIGQLAERLGIESGYKVSLNAGRFAEVPHLHYHLQGGWEEGGMMTSADSSAQKTRSVRRQADRRL